jgi:uncharacterized repeat protein (TIGR01451 family)
VLIARAVHAARDHEIRREVVRMRHRTQWLQRSLAGGTAALALSLALAAPIAAQSSSPAPGTLPPPEDLTVTTTYPSIEVDPGGEATFPISVTSPSPERVDLAVTTAPEGFRTSLRGGGSIVGSVFTTGDGEAPDLELRVDVPDEAAAGTYEVVLTASAAAGSVELPLDLVVSDTSAGSVTMTTDFPALRGDSEATFQFNLRLTNDTSQELTFGLSGVGPDGWTVEVTPSGQEQAATAVVGAGENQNVRVTVTPLRFAEAGQYPIAVIADAGSGRQATTDLLVELTGSYDMTFSSADGRLNTTASAGSTTTFSVAVTNTGTAPLEAIALSGTAPSGWEVTFETETIEAIPIGETVTANARITPSGNAVAGDYIVTLTARNDQVSENIQVRTTVETSQIWGIVGIALIGLVVVGLFLVFRRYGRR